jgi:putative pre-16S rRNA nuclease
MSAVLGIDYGDARIGLAVTDAERRTTLALRSVPANPEADALAIIRQVILASGVERLVLGLPLTLEGKEGVQAAKTRAFGDNLGDAVQLPLEYVDERFSTRSSRAAARAKQSDADAEAARLILQTWLDRQTVA